MTRSLLIAGVIAACLAACTSPQRRLERERARAVRSLKAFKQAQRAKLAALPSCATPLAERALTLGARTWPAAYHLRVPLHFRHDTTARYFHGGHRFTSANTVLEAVSGQFGPGSVLDERGQVPNGCRLHQSGRLFVVSDTTTDAGVYWAAAMWVTDTVDFTGHMLFAAHAPRRVRQFLLWALPAADTAG